MLYFCDFIFFFFSSRRRHTRCALVTGVQTCALPISELQRPCQALLQIAADLERVSLRLPFHHGLAVGIENTDARAALADIQTHAVCCFVPDRRAVRSGAGCCALPAIVAHCAARIAMSRPAPV